jgi:hypothetical protein
MAKKKKKMSSTTPRRKGVVSKQVARISSRGLKER